MHLLAALVFGCAAVASGYQIAQLVAAHLFFRRARRAAAARPAGAFTPPVTILKPLKGPGIDLYANLASFCRQSYPRYQIVFGVADRTDAAIAVVRRLQRDFPDRDLVLAVGDGSEHATNRKVGNLVQMMRRARHDVLALSDADIRVRPDYLRTLVAPLADPRVGLTTCLYRGRGYFGVPSVLESLFINTDFIPMVLLAQWLNYALGASIAVRREALERIGGFEVLADYLADDYQLGNRVAAAGYRLVLLPYVVETVLDSVTLGDVWRHQLRWARTYRVCQPVGWFFSVVTHAVLWGALAVLVTHGAPVGWLALAAALVCRLGSLAGIMRLLRERETPRHLWLVPLKDLGYSAVWLASWLGRRVDWSGEVFRVERDGRMTPLAARVAVGYAAPPAARVARGGGRDGGSTQGLAHPSA